MKPAPRGFVTRPWGGFETIEEGPGYKVKRLVVEPGSRLSLQRHRLRAGNHAFRGYSTGDRVFDALPQPGHRRVRNR